MIFKYPIFSFLEMEFIPQFLIPLINPYYFWLFRLLSALIIILVILLLSQKFKNKFLGLMILITSPWLFILSKEFNPLVLFFLLLLSLLTQNKFSRWGKIIIGLYLIIYLFFNKFQLPSFNEKIQLLKDSFTLTSLFFQGENLSSYLRIPKIGYFLTILLPIFLRGLYFLKKIKNFYFILLVSLIFFAFYPTNHFIFAAVGLLFLCQIIIIEGINSLKFKRLLFFLFIIGYIISSFFFFEIYFRHYQVKYGPERRYAKIQLVEKLTKLANKKIIMTKDEEIKKLLNIYSYHYRLPSVTFIDKNQWKKIFNQCNFDPNLCILEEATIEQMNLNKDDPNFDFVREANGIKVYFIINK